MTYFFGVYYKNKHQNLTTPALSYLQQWASNGNITTALKSISVKGFSAAVNSTDESYQLNKDGKTIMLGELSRQYFDKLSLSALSDIEGFYKQLSNALLSNNTSFLNQLNGAFSWVLYDINSHQLYLLRDHLGWANLCYFETETALYFANDISLLTECPDYKLVLNQSYISQSLHKNILHNHDQTAFDNIRYFPPHHMGRYTNTLKVKSYWSIFNIKSFKSTNEDELVNRFENILIQPFLNKSNHFALMLSGGCDSSLLAALLTKAKIPFKAYSYYFKKFSHCNETYYINQTVKKLNLDHQYITVDDALPFDNLNALIERQSLDNIHFNNFHILDYCVYDAIAKDGITSLVTGHFGDDLFYGGESLFSELLHAKLLRTYLSQQKFSASRVWQSLIHKPHYKHILKYILMTLSPKMIEARQSKKLHKQFNHLLEDRTYQLLENNIKIPYGTRRHLYHMLNIRQFHAGITDVRKSLYQSHHFNIYLPYVSVDMIEFIWQTSPQMLDRSPYKNRYLQRLALSKNGLDFIAQRQDKTSFYPVLDKGVEINHDKIKTLYKDSYLLKDNLINENTFDITNTIDVNQFISVEIWYRQFCQCEEK